MLPIYVPDKEFFNEETMEFFTIKGTTLHLEHSLVSISKWEAIWKVPFISNKEKTREQVKSYIKCMTLTQNVDPHVYDILTDQNYKDITDYIDDPMTASWVNAPKDGKKSSEQVTSELIYWWMTSLRIPWEAQKWHLNRLMMLIRIGNVKSQPPKKMKKGEILSRNRRLNEERRRRMHSKG